ncbi:DUF6710 family protein [Streptococcus suis]
MQNVNPMLEPCSVFVVKIKIVGVIEMFKIIMESLESFIRKSGFYHLFYIKCRDRETKNSNNIFDIRIKKVKQYLKHREYVELRKYLSCLTRREMLRIANAKFRTKYSTLRIGVIEELEKMIKSEYGVEYIIDCYYFGRTEIDSERNQSRGIFCKKNSSKLTITLHSQPALFNIWKEDVIQKILNNQFPKMEVKEAEITNCYYYPLDLLVSSNGNHRQFGMSLDKECTKNSFLEEIKVVTPIYQYIRFDGEKYWDIKKLTPLFETTSDVERLIGFFFEVGRLLNRHLDYFPDFVNENFPNGF